MCQISAQRPQNTQQVQNAQKAFQPQDLANQSAQQAGCGPKGIDQLFNQDRLEKAGAANKAASPERPQTQQAEEAQKAQAAKDPKEMMKQALGAIGDIIGKVIEGVTGNKGLADMFKNLFSQLGGGQQQPQLPAANQAAP
jgi:hypothetical protein